MNYINQIGKDDCGFACLKMILAHVHKDHRYLFLPQNEKEGALSFKKILEIAKKHNLELEAFRVEDKDELRKNKEFPMMARILLSDGTPHLIIVEKRIGSLLKIVDPDRGKYLVRLSTFIEMWDGNGFLIKGFVKTACPYSDFSPIPLKDKIASALFQILSAAFLLSGVYFIKEDAYFYWPIVFISLFAIVEIIYRGSLFRMMQRLDADFDIIMSTREGEERIELFHRYEEYKKSAIQLPMNFIFTILVCVFIIAVILLNGFENVLLLSVSVACAALESFIFAPFSKSKIKMVGQEEKHLDKIKGQSEFLETIQDIRDDAYAIAKSELFRKIVFLFIFFGTALLTMMFEKAVSITYVVFYMSIMWVSFQNFTTLLGYEEKIQEFNFAKVKIINILHLNDEKNGN